MEYPWSLLHFEVENKVGLEHILLQMMFRIKNKVGLEMNLDDNRILTSYDYIYIGIQERQTKPKNIKISLLDKF